MNYQHLSESKKELDTYRPLNPHLLNNLESWFKVELTYTSNALEGNTLSRRETALVVEKGLTVGGKTLVEHLEATNHAKALDWVKERVEDKKTKLTNKDILRMHELILSKIDDDNAGVYRNIAVRISGSTVIFPNPRKVYDLMSELGDWLAKGPLALHPVEFAAEAHYRLVTIHPFIDGNGRTARLLMNLLLMKAGYPPAIIKTSDRLHYLAALEKAQLGGSKNDYLALISSAVKRSFVIYLNAVKGKNAEKGESDKLLKIGELAKKVGESNSTLRHWTQQGLISIAATTPSGYQLYAAEMVARIALIHQLKKKRFSLAEIRDQLLK